MRTTTTSIEEKVAEAFRSIRTGVEEKARSGEGFVRAQPVKGILWSIATGYVLRLMPIAFIVRVIVSILSFSLRPLAFSYVGAKVWELFKLKTARDEKGRDLAQATRNGDFGR